MTAQTCSESPSRPCCLSLSARDTRPTGMPILPTSSLGCPEPMGELRAWVAFRARAASTGTVAGTDNLGGLIGGVGVPGGPIPPPGAVIPARR